jgi:DNA-binding NarL/FixJ family response regulator
MQSRELTPHTHIPVLPALGREQKLWLSRPGAGNHISLRILIVDDHEIVRMGVRLLLSGHPDWELCGEASDGRQAIEKVVELGPDVVILDLTMPELNGFQAAQMIRRLTPSAKIIFFSMHEIPVTARAVGGDAFVAKSAAATDLPAALHRVAEARAH